MNLTKIRERREELNYTQEYMAAKLGISQNMYSMIESGRSPMKVDHLVVIAKELDADLNDLLQQEPFVVNMDNAKIEHGAGAVFNSSIFTMNETNQEIIELLKELTHLLVNINNNLKKE